MASKARSGKGVIKSTPGTDSTEKQQYPHRFKPGQSGNPKGRPKGSRNKLSEDFIKALAEDFETNGVEAVQKVRSESPAQYLKLVADLVPKDLNVNHSATETFNSIWQMIGQGKINGDES